MPMARHQLFILTFLAPLLVASTVEAAAAATAATATEVEATDDATAAAAAVAAIEHLTEEESEEATMEKAEELLRQVVRYGIDQGEFLSEVREKELYDRGIRLTKADPAHFVAIFNKQKPKSLELSKYAYASLEASSLLARQFMLTRPQVVYGLERVELRQTDLAQRCPRQQQRRRQQQLLQDEGADPNEEEEESCPNPSFPYRTPDGSCNNLAHPDWGATFNPFLRFLPPVYGDALGAEFRRPVASAVGGGGGGKAELPSPRRISSAIHKDSALDTAQFSVMVMQWGQFVDHDMTFTAMKRGFNNSMIKCCGDDGRALPDELRHRDCVPIEIPEDDAFFAQFNRTCMEFVRSAPASKRDCSLGPREQQNQVTSFIDASNVYGSTKEEMDGLRLFKDGKLRYTDLHIRKSLLPPLEQRTANDECRISTPNLHCFHAGDGRVNEQPGLTGMHTLWLREHNRLARALKELNPHWNDEIIFQETRKIVGAMHQHITYNEWLPIVLGPRVLDIFELKLNPRGHYEGYNASVNPTVANAFAAAALRFGHSLIRNTLTRCNKDFNEVPYFVRLHKELNNPSNLHNFGSVDRILLGLTSKAMPKRDEFITSEVTNHLFQNSRTQFGMDLASINIQRGRDHGLAPYNVWREQCGLQKFRRFEEMTDVISPSTVRSLEQVYADVDDVDLFTGGLSERPVVGGLVGPTFACIIGQQFLNLRKGDRFWYENANVFTQEQLQEIRKSSLSRAICDNLDDIEMLQPYAFLMLDDNANRRMACKGSGVPEVDMAKWKEEPLENKEEGGGSSYSTEQVLPRNKAQQQQQQQASPDSLVRQDKVPFLVREVSSFTAEVPRQISREQFFRFYDKEEKDVENEVGEDGDDEGHFFSGRGARKASKYSRQIVQKLFTEMLKKDDDVDAHLLPSLV